MLCNYYILFIYPGRANAYNSRCLVRYMLDASSVIQRDSRVLAGNQRVSMCIYSN